MNTAVSHHETHLTNGVPSHEVQKGIRNIRAGFRVPALTASALLGNITNRKVLHTTIENKIDPISNSTRTTALLVIVFTKQPKKIITSKKNIPSDTCVRQVLEKADLHAKLLLASSACMYLSKAMRSACLSNNVDETPSNSDAKARGALLQPLLPPRKLKNQLPFILQFFWSPSCKAKGTQDQATTRATRNAPKA